MERKSMLDRAGEPQNDLARLGPEVNNLRFELSGCRLEWSGWNKAESRVICEFFQRFKVEDGPIIWTLLRLGDANTKPSTATVLSPADMDVLEDVDVRLDG